MKPSLLYRKNGFIIMQIKEEVDEHIIKQGSRKSLSICVFVFLSSMATATTVKKMVLLTVLCFLLMLQELQVKNVEGGCMAMAMAVGGKMDCGSACNYRCSKSSRNKMCIRACNTCCDRCNCVPPGTSGNKDVCPCYAEMTTHGGKLKCP